MVGLYPAVLVVVAIVLVRNRGRPGGRGWPWFAAWWAAGGLFAFSFVTGFSIGLFVLPFAAAGLFLVAARAPRVRESIGFVAGVGTLALAVAWSNRSYEPCPEHGELTVPPGAPPGTSVSCGGTDPTVWLVAGLCLTAAAVAAYALTRRRIASRG